jgi:hypothetical protein
MDQIYEFPDTIPEEALRHGTIMNYFGAWSEVLSRESGQDIDLGFIASHFHPNYSEDSRN